MTAKPTPKKPRLRDASKVIEVDFTYEAPEAKQVLLAGSFNNWNVDNLPMRQDQQGMWRVRVPLQVGRHEYRFIADGVWNDDPHACAYTPNEFGWCNCVIEVAPTENEHSAPQS